MPVPASILIVDDHVVIARAMADSLKSEGYDPVEYVPDDALDVEGVLAIGRRLQPEVALVDLNLGAGRSGIPLVGPLVGLGIKVISFTASDDPLDRARCMEAGASAFLHKAAAFDILLSTIERVVAGDEVISAGERHELLAGLRASRAARDERLARLATLAPREQAVLEGLMAGKTAGEIAEQSYISIKTVRTHIEAILRKLGVRSQLAAVAMAAEMGWRPNDDGVR